MVAAAVAVAGVAGAAISANAAGDAADTQAGAARDASAVQDRANQQIRQDLSPWVNSGRDANNLLSTYLGTGAGSTPTGGGSWLTADQIRQQLVGQYTRPGAGVATAATPQAANDPNHIYTRDEASLFGLASAGSGENSSGYGGQGGYSAGNYSRPGDAAGAGNASTIDEAGLNAAIQQRLAEQQQQQQQQQTSAQADPRYGSLLTPYRNGQEFSFTGADLASDPGYKFGLDQGTQGIDRGQASRGNYLSGGAMKELARFNEDYAGTKFNDGFNRASSTWGTNLGAYNQNRNTIYSFLTGQSTIGQNAAARVGAANQQTATNIGNNTLAAGNAASAGQVAGGNALASGINTAANAYNSSNTSSAAGWNSLISSGPSPYGASSTSVSGTAGWSGPTNNVFSGSNGRL